MSPWPDDDDPYAIAPLAPVEPPHWSDLEDADRYADDDESWAERNRKWREKYREHNQRHPCVRVYCPGCGQVYHAQRQLNGSWLMTRHNTYAATGIPTYCPGGSPDPEADKAA